jgi:hypothetical protein
VPRLFEFYLVICLTTEEKARKNLNHGKKNLSQVKKNLIVQYKYYQNTHNILPKHVERRERYKLKGQNTERKINMNAVPDRTDSDRRARTDLKIAGKKGK